MASARTSWFSMNSAISTSRTSLRRSGRASSRPGFALGSAGAFLVIESKAHAIARGAKPYRAPVERGRRPAHAQAARRRHGDAGEALVAARHARWRRRHHHRRDRRRAGHLGGARLPCRSTRILRCGRPAPGSVTPWRRSFRSASGLRRLSISRGALFPPGDSSGTEIEMSRPPTQIVVVGAGHWRGEGMALVEAVK